MGRPRSEEHYGWCDNIAVEDVVPTKEPVPMLTVGAEKRVDEAMKNFAFKKCDDYVELLMKCTQVRDRRLVSCTNIPHCAKIERTMDKDRKREREREQALTEANFVSNPQENYAIISLFACQKQKNDMLECMRTYWKDEYRDVYRRAYGNRYKKAPFGWTTPEYDVPGVSNGENPEQPTTEP